MSRGLPWWSTPAAELARPLLTDNFRRRDHSGWAKAGWTLLVIFLPLIGVLIYMITRLPEDIRTTAMTT